MSAERRIGNILGVSIDALDWDATSDRILAWAHLRESRYVAVCNVHVVVSAARNAVYRQFINGADMATPDGAPVAWVLQCLGFSGQPRVNGPDLMWALCKRCAAEGLSVYCYGSTEVTLVALEERLRQDFPQLVIGGMVSPPFRSLTAEEEGETIERINTSGAAIIFIGLGCPKQELWMATHRGQVNAVMIGVGAAFDFNAGTVKRAPKWMQENGLEWLHRLLSDPMRLWKRYFITNTLFILGIVRQFVFKKL